MEAVHTPNCFTLDFVVFIFNHFYFFLVKGAFESMKRTVELLSACKSFKFPNDLGT